MANIQSATNIKPNMGPSDTNSGVFAISTITYNQAALTYNSATTQYGGADNKIGKAPSMASVTTE